MSEKHGSVLSVGKAFVLLGCLANAGRPLTLKELSERTGWAKSTVHGLLSAMREYRAVTQDNADGRYGLGTYLFDLGMAVSRQWDILEVAKPYLQSVSIAANESVCLGVLDGDSILILDCVASQNPMRVVTDTGARLPLHASAMGKALLAAMPEGEALLQRSALNAYTPHTLTDIASIREEWPEIRKNGYAIENGEMRVGMRGVAAAIPDHTGTYKYAISVYGMFRKVTDEGFLRSEELILEAAARISSAMGAV